MNPLSNETGLLLASIVPVLVIGWSIVFSVEAARRGTAWSYGHLAVVATVLKLALSLAIVAMLVVRPIWVGLGIAYPLGVALMIVLTRRRQIAFVEKEMGFGEVRPQVRDRVLARLRRGLIVVAASSLVVGASLATVGVVQGWVVAALAPIAAVSLLRARTGPSIVTPGTVAPGTVAPAAESQVGGQVPPSL